MVLGEAGWGLPPQEQLAETGNTWGLLLPGSGLLLRHPWVRRGDLHLGALTSCTHRLPALSLVVFSLLGEGQPTSNNGITMLP